MIRFSVFSALFTLVLSMGCGRETSGFEKFELVLTENAVDGFPLLRYTLTDSLLTITQLDSGVSEKGQILQTIPVYMEDSLRFISPLDVKARDCREQHALEGFTVLFTRQDTTVHVDPNVNHPKELDYAIRLINRITEPKYHLHFTDMQTAIEPSGKMEI